MVIKGRSRSNGAQLAEYLLQSKENDRAYVLDIRGTAQPHNLKKSLLEMSLSSDLTKRGKLGLYHAQVNPAIGEDQPMTPEDWLKAADILERHLGLEGQKRAIVLHEKKGRLHGHIVWEKYDHETGRLRSDSHNYKKHDKARAEIEHELGHEHTPQKSDREPTNKERLTRLWQEHPDGENFIEAAQKLGYQVAQGNARRPFRVITPDGQSLDLARQLDGIKTKEVRDRLQPLRDSIITEVEALQRLKGQSQLQQSDFLCDLSDSQNIAIAMLRREKKPLEAPSLPRDQDQKSQSDNLNDLSDQQTQAAAMLEQYRQRQAERQERQRKEQEMRQQAAEQTKKQQEAKTLTDQAAEMLEAYRKRQRDRGRDGLEY